MSKLLNLITNEPVMTAIGALVGATIAVLVAFGVHVTPVQREALEGWCIAALGLGIAVRSQVTPKRKAQPGGGAPQGP